MMRRPNSSPLRLCRVLTAQGALIKGAVDECECGSWPTALADGTVAVPHPARRGHRPQKRAVWVRTHHRPGPGTDVCLRDGCPDTGLVRLSHGQARALLDEYMAVGAVAGTGWDCTSTGTPASPTSARPGRACPRSWRSRGTKAGVCPPLRPPLGRGDHRSHQPAPARHPPTLNPAQKPAVIGGEMSTGRYSRSGSRPGPCGRRAE